MQAQGQYIGGKAPYGYQLVDGELIEDDVEQGVIAQARELRDSGLSLAKIAAALDKRGFRARNQRPFVAQQIKRMVA